MMRRFFGILIAAVTCVAVGIAVAQQSIPPGSQPPVAPSGSTVEGQEVEGKISKLDRTAGTVTLDNGQEYVIPDVLNANWGRMKEGATIKMRYGTDGGRNTATFLEVQQ
jgi:Protein of unknown function (DUF1344)